MATIGTLAEWRSLPAFDRPEGHAIDVTVIRTGFLVVASSELDDDHSAHSLPAGDGAHRVFGTITVERAGAPTLMKLSAPLCAWAVDCCAQAKLGRTPFPAQIAFRWRAEGVEVGRLQRTACISPDELVVYVDESGNTGDVAIRGSLDQPTFALAGLGESEGTDRLAEIMLRLKSKHGIQAREIKTRTMDRYPEFVCELVDSICTADVPLFIELMDKHFFVAANIVSHALGASRFLHAPSGVLVANAMADMLTHGMSSSVLDSYRAFGGEPSPVTFKTFCSTLREAVASARRARPGDEARLVLEQILEMFEETLLHREQEAEAKPGYLKLLPPPDQSTHKKRIAMLPHVPAFTDLYARINRFSDGSSGVRVIHDEQLQFGPLLEGYAATLESNEYAAELLMLPAAKRFAWRFLPGKFNLEFVNSRLHPGVQAADVLARFCTRRFNEVAHNQFSGDATRRAARVLEQSCDVERQLGVNLVTTTRRLELFYNA